MIQRLEFHRFLESGQGETRGDLVMLRFDLVSSIHPGCESTEECIHFYITILQKEERRTGARVFIWSGAVGDDPLIFFERKIANVILEIFQRNRDRAIGMTCCV